jgi:SP family sugar:H+ symporter-like MFS transporter
MVLSRRQALTQPQVIAKLTPLMLSGITYGTFLLFGTCCVIMGVYTVFCVPETKNVPLESIHHLFEGRIIAGCIRDTIPRYSRAKQLQHHHVTSDDASGTIKPAHKGVVSGVEHVEEA